MRYRLFYNDKSMNHGSKYGDRSEPAGIGDDFALTAATQIRRQLILLYTGFSLSIPGVIAIADPTGSPLVGVLIPLAVLASALSGLFFLFRYRPDSADPAAATKLLGQIQIFTIVIVALGSLWCAASWLAATPQLRMYYTLMMALGGYATGYCIAPLRKSAIACVIILLLPNAAMLISSGQRMDLIAGGTMLLAASFQLFLIANHSKLLRELLGHRSQARQLARVDSLTGLLNRGALLDEISQLRGKPANLRLMVVDIDNFKAINDTFGHDMGDQVLREIGIILSRYANDDVGVARLGGEEFALFGPVDRLPEGVALKVLSDIRNASLAHNEQVTVSIGIAEGQADSEQTWRALYVRADGQLYLAKNSGRNQIRSEQLQPVSAPAENIAA